jgi:hypothetical protein
VLIEHYIGKYCYRFGNPNVLVVVKPERFEYVAEWHLFVELIPPGSGITHRSCRLNFNLSPTALKELGIENPEQFLMREALDHLNNTIMSLQFAECQDHKDPFPIVGVKEWKKSDDWADEIFRLRLRGLDGEILKHIANNGVSDEVARVCSKHYYIEPMKVMDVIPAEK